MKCYIFDLDGVLTHLSEKKVTQTELFGKIEDLLNKGEVVALNTGRSLDFIEKEIFLPLVDQILNKSLLERFLAVGEKGGVWSDVKNGEIELEKDLELVLPEELKQKVIKLIESKYSESMFFDYTKYTMISLEMTTSYDMEKYQSIQKELTKDLENILKSLGLSDEFKLDPTLTACDIQKKYAGKDLGVRRIIAWLDIRGLKPEEFISFGDSKADIEMAEELYKTGKPVTFVFVGPEEYVKDKNFPFKLIVTREKFEPGTLEYLKT